MRPSGTTGNSRVATVVVVDQPEVVVATERSELALPDVTGNAGWPRFAA